MACGVGCYFVQTGSKRRSGRMNVDIYFGAVNRQLTVRRILFDLRRTFGDAFEFDKSLF